MSNYLLRYDKTRQYDSQFDLVNHIIEHVTHLVHSGQSLAGVNLATDVVKELLGGRTVTQMERRLEEVIESADWEEEEQTELEKLKEAEALKRPRKKE